MSSRSTPISKYSKIKVGITFGDPAGIGPFIIAKALKRIAGLAEFVIIGDKWIFEQASGPDTGKPAKVEFVDLHNVSRKNFKFGQFSAHSGRASIEYLDRALELIKQKRIDCLVTCPISKAAINLAGYSYSGHTEYLAGRESENKAGMMLLNGDLRFVLATRHIPFREVPAALSEDRIVEAALLGNRALKELFLIRQPRLVVCGLNPHASDSGLIGNEEERVILPAIKRLRSQIGYIDGPLSADVAIAKAKKGGYDCVIAMYHDQALIPLKLLGRDRGVNLTLGLKFVRTSPLHGTAFDIAGTGRANPGSLIEAVNLALRCTLNQKRA